MDRDPALERHLLDVAARSAGLPGDGGLHAFAAARTLPGPVRLPRDFDQELREEIADGANYAAWAIQQDYAAVLAGDSAVLADYERRMRALAALTVAWRELHTGGA